MVWNPYVGSDALLLAVALLAIGVFLIYFGTRLKRAIKIPRAGGALSVLIVVVWVVCLVILLVPPHYLESGSATCYSIRKHPIGAYLSYHVPVGYIHVCRY